MKIVNVTPITKGVFKDNLSYFTTKDLKPGALVTVPVRKKIVPAIVITSIDAKNLKTSLKNSDFNLKSIKSIKSESFLPKEFIEACKEIAEYYMAPVGSIIKEFIPQVILDSNIETPKIKREIKNIILEPKKFQAPTKERLQHYKSIIREEFARNKSVFFCLPVTSDIEEIQNEIQKGIENYTVVLKTEMTKKKMKDEWTRALNDKHPLLIISTKSFLSLPREDINTIIIENEGSRFYKQQTRPYIDIRTAVNVIASKSKINLIFGDEVIRTETYHKLESGPVSRTLSEASQKIVEINRDGKEKTFEIISNELKEEIKSAHSNNEKTVLFINRKGYTPTTVCNDCHKTILCEKCSSPLVLHKKAKTKDAIFVCHKCMNETVAPEKCPYCKSWRLQTLGIGIQKAEEEINKLFPNIKLFIIDSDIVKNKKQGDEIVKNFLASPGSILIGTEILFSHLKQQVERSAVLSLDALFTFPDFRINERIFKILLKLRSLAKKSFLIQTRLPENQHELFNNALRGNISEFYRNELDARKKLQYPPFKLLIKITKESKDKTILKKDIKKLEKDLEKWNPLSYQAFIQKIKDVYSWHIILKLDSEKWPYEEKELYDLLSSLPPTWKININPESLL